MTKRKSYDLDQIIESYSHNDVLENRLEYTVDDLMTEHPGMSRAVATELHALIRAYVEN